MYRELLKSKIHRVTVTGTRLDYEGSLAICPRLLDRSGMMVGEKVLVANVNTGVRFETYIICGEKGEICLNGAAARLGEVGDKLIVMSFGWYAENEIANYRSVVVTVDGYNAIIENNKSEN